MPPNTHSQPLNVVIVGGSSAGLIHGIMIKRLGHNVHILEQYPSSSRDGQAAGVSTGAQTQQFLQKYDLVTEPCVVSASALQIVDSDFKLLELRQIPFKMTTWKMLHYRLRANFDGFSSEYVPNPPAKLNGDGKAVFDIGKRVTDVAFTDGVVKLKFEDLINGGGGDVQADLVIAADGFRSTIRQLLVPSMSSTYSGYLTWRATIPESRISEETLQAFRDRSTSYKMYKSYVIVYLVPGEDGGLQPGERQVNFVWYYNCPGNSEEFVDIMTDIDGHRHRSTVPPGKIRPKVWAKQQAYGRRVLAAPVKELVDKITSPFVTAISDYQAPRASFFANKLLLVGDALALFRPHIAQSTNQAATDCMLLEKTLVGEMDFSEWEKQVTHYAHLTRLRSNAVGTQNLSGFVVWLFHEPFDRICLEGERMTFEDWEASVDPKFRGSWNLHQLLPKGMDFFVLLSSLCGVVGKETTANYAAGNSYMDALAHHRVQCGERAVSLDLSIMEEEGLLAENKDLMTRMKAPGNLVPILSSQLHALLDYYCKPGHELFTPLQCQTVVGIEVPAKLHSKGIEPASWMYQPTFHHFFQMDKKTTTATGVDKAINFATVFTSVGSVAEAGMLVADALMDRLSSSTSIAKEDMDVNRPMHQYGVDSLVAIEIRNWFAKKLNADIAVFDILGDSTFADIGVLGAGRSSYKRASWSDN